MHFRLTPQDYHDLRQSMLAALIHMRNDTRSRPTGFLVMNSMGQLYFHPSAAGLASTDMVLGSTKLLRQALHFVPLCKEATISSDLSRAIQEAVIRTNQENVKNGSTAQSGRSRQD